MLFDKSKKQAIYMEGNLDSDYGKMGFGVMRYSENPICAVIDSRFAGQSVKEAVGQPFDYPVVATVEEAKSLGAEIMILGIAPSGGKFPDEWVPPMEQSLNLGMSLVNGLHDRLEPRFKHLLRSEDQKIWDIRVPASNPPIAMARAANLNNKRVLMVGTDMAAGKMTSGLELYKWVKNQGISSEFLATGQIGITVTGKGIPLDAYIVDKAAGAVEQLVLSAQDKEVVFIEGQGSLLHPGSTATLPLMRGSCATHLILCHRADMHTLRGPKHVKIPNFKEFIALNEALTGVCGSLTQAKTIGIAINSSRISEEETNEFVRRVEGETGLPVADVIRHGPNKLGKALLDSF